MQRYCLFLAGIAGVFLLPSIAIASVRINEIAWMGTQDSTSHEWVELYNDGADSVSLDGFELESSNFSLGLKGTIEGGGYFLIKRTSDFSEIPTADLFGSFGSGLRNSGDTLSLKSQTGAAMDEVVGGTDWKSVGGDNDKNLSAQRSVGGWVTAEPTPRSANASQGVTQAPAETVSQSDSSASTEISAGSSSSDNSKTDSTPKIIATKVTISGPSEANARALAAFTLSISGTDQRYDADKITWNFGDGETAQGLSVQHKYIASGAYVVFATAKVGGNEFTTQKSIIVRDPNVFITDVHDGADGYIRITSKQNIDIGGWALRDGMLSFIFPAHTIIGGGSGVAFGNSATMQYSHGTPALFDASGRLMFAYGDRENADQSVVANYTNAMSASHPMQQPEQSPAPKQTVKPATTTITLDENPLDARRSVAGSALAGGLGRASTLPYWFGLFTIIGVSCAVAYWASRRLDPNQLADDEAAKYTIVDIDSNLERE